jgi:rhodanese-related sulfurtransferase
MNKFIDIRSFYIAIAIVLVSAVVGFIYNAAYPKGIPVIRHKVKVGDTLAVPPVFRPPDTGLTADTNAASRVLGLEQTFRTFQSRQVIFLDARSEALYSEGHIAGAMSLPESKFDDVYPTISGLLNPGAHIIVYCQGKDCDESMIVRERLVEMAYKHVDIFLGGWPEWKQAGYPVETGIQQKEAK